MADPSADFPQASASEATSETSSEARSLTDRYLEAQGNFDILKKEALEKYKQVEQDTKGLAEKVLDRLPITKPFDSDPDNRGYSWQNRKGTLATSNGEVVYLDVGERKSHYAEGEPVFLSSVKGSFHLPSDPDSTISLHVGVPDGLIELINLSDTPEGVPQRRYLAEIRASGYEEADRVSLSRDDSFKGDLLSVTHERIKYFLDHSEELKLVEGDRDGQMSPPPPSNPSGTPPAAPPV